MTTFTDKELIKEIKERISSLEVRDDIERRAYEIALASLEADPVAYIFKHPAGKLFWALTDESNKEQADVIPVYAAPPVPVVPAALPENDDDDGHDIDYLEPSEVYSLGRTAGWNACRAVMLQSGNFREIAETSTNSPVIPSEVLSAILKFARVRADFDDFDGDRRGIGDCLDETEHEPIVTINKYASQLAVVLVGLDERAAFNAWNNEENLPIAGVSAKNAAWLAWQARAELGRSLAVNSPVTPDGWISCSERMPDSKTAVLVAREFDRKGDWRMKWATYIPGHPDANDGWIIPGASWKPSHWMPLPEPPQEVK